MNGTIKKVFLIIALLVLIFLIWQLFFNEDGILVTGYNAMAHGINEQFQEATGDTKRQILPYWGSESENTTSNTKDNGKGFDMSTEH